MTTVDSLILDLLDWLSTGDRGYAEVMDAWRTSCPRLPVWEDANDHGLITTEDVDGRLVVRLTCGWPHVAGTAPESLKRPDVRY